MLHTRKIFFIAVALFLALLAPAGLNAKSNDLAIFAFKAADIEAMSYNGEILYALVSALEKDKSINLMPRREMEEILNRAGLVQSSNPNTAIEAGKALGTDFIICGKVAKKDELILTEIKLIDIENRQVLETWKRDFSGHEDIWQKIPAFAIELSSVIKNKEEYLSVSPLPKAEPKKSVHHAAYRTGAAIEDLKAVKQGKAVVLTWKFVSDQVAACFSVYRSDKLTGPYQFLGKTDKLQYNDISIKKNGPLYYKIRIILDCGREISTGRSVLFKPVEEKLPYPPIIMSTVGFVRKTRIEFVPSLSNRQKKFKIIRYKVYRKNNSSGDWEQIKIIDANDRSSSKVSFVVEDTAIIEDGREYIYAISSLDKKHKESPLSDLITITTIYPPVLSIKEDNLLRKINLTWLRLKNVKGYCLYRKCDQEDWKIVSMINDENKTNWSDQKELKDGRKYSYYLAARGANGETEPSTEIKAKTKDLPPVPKSFNAKSGFVKSVELSWTPFDDPDVGGYSIYRGPDETNLVKTATVKGCKSDSFMDKGKLFSPLEDGMKYYYLIAAFNLFDAEGKASKPIAANTKPRPGKSKGLTATVKKDCIFIKWNKNPEPDIKAYILYRSKNKGRWSKLLELNSSQTSHTDKNLKPELNYCYQIIAEDKDGLKSDPSESNTISSPLIKIKG